MLYIFDVDVDIFSTGGKYFLTAADKFSKFSVVQPVPSRSIKAVKAPILQLIDVFPNIATVYCDNEPAFVSETMRSLLKGHSRSS